MFCLMCACVILDKKEGYLFILENFLTLLYEVQKEVHPNNSHTTVVRTEYTGVLK
jgi:hypothetical protein